MRILLPLFLVLAVAASAWAGDPTIPDLSPSWCEAAPGRLVIVPSGEGPALIDQGVEVHVWLRDGWDQPIANYPFQDVWLDDPGTGDIALCQGGFMADANTDAEGHCVFTAALFGGGWTQNGMSVYVSGVAVPQTPRGSDYVLDLQVNSPDINGDRAVNLADISIFAGDLTGYTFRSDFNHDNALDLGDISLFSGWLGSLCP